jgi:periplasmic protein CpxP/Spy
MKTLQRHLLTATLLAGLGFAAVAQPQTPPQAAPGGPRMMQGEHGRMNPARMEQRRARMEQRMARRMDELKRVLQITPQQEGAWTTWTAALKPTQRQRPDRAEFARLTTPERIDRMRALRAQRNAQVDQRLEATKAFYGALSAEQKRLFVAEGMRFARGGKRDGMGGKGRHHRG